MNVVFLASQFLPKPSANGVCVYQLAKEYVTQGAEVHVVCYRQSKENSEETIEKINVHRIKVPIYKRMELYADSNPTPIMGKIARVISRTVGCAKKLLHITEYPLKDYYVVRAFKRAVLEINQRLQVDTLVAVYNPIEAIKAGENIKKSLPNMKTVFYSLDTLSNEGGYGILPVSFRAKMGYRQEMHYFKVYDRIILMNCHRSHYEQYKYAEYADKIKWADFPLLSKPNAKHENIVQNNTIVYVGYLHKVMRNPKYAIECLTPFLNQFSLHFYGRGDCEDIIHEYKVKKKLNIVNHGFVSHQEAREAENSASILLSIGNSDTKMAPSKIYEYIATGKPIIHVYSYDEDSCIEVLKKYDNAICIREGMSFDGELDKFINNAHEIQTEVISDAFASSLPSYTIRLLNE